MRNVLLALLAVGTLTAAAAPAQAAGGCGPYGHPTYYGGCAPGGEWGYRPHRFYGPRPFFGPPPFFAGPRYAWRRPYHRPHYWY